MAKIDLGNLLVEYQTRQERLNAGVDQTNVRRQRDDYFLFLLGTDTIFVKEPTRNLAKGTKGRRDYKRGETLSFTAQAIVHMKGERATIGMIDSPLAYNSESVAVVNGPTTLGKEVGNRIVWALYLIIDAVMKGKKTLQISAHSRGAVEAFWDQSTSID